jgi:hypothetical protein
MAKKATMAKASPKGGKRGCLGPDGTYDAKWCDGTLPAQGIGSDVQQGISNVNHTINQQVITTSRG